MINNKKPVLQATGDWLVIKPIPREDQDSRIIIPDAVKESLQADAEPAIVISAGEECSEGLEPGVTAYVLLGSCLTLPLLDGESYLICKNSRVAGFVPQ